jgi:hypothetical protein
MAGQRLGLVRMSEASLPWGGLLLRQLLLIIEDLDFSDAAFFLGTGFGFAALANERLVLGVEDGCILGITLTVT